KRKWDQDDNTEGAPVTKVTKVDVDPSKAVSEAAARINAMLAQKGIPLHEEGHAPSDTPSKNEGEFVKDIPINDLKNRYMLTRGATQTQIQQETGADVITRGKYYPDVQLASDKEPPLYLHITASSKQSLDKAIAKIEELIETAQVPLPGSGYPPREERPDMNKRPERKFHEKRLPVDIGVTPHFNLRAKIVGPNGAFVKHIQQETGCRVQLKGKGSGFYESSTGVESEEPLHVHISCAREEGLEAGVKLTQDLLDTVKAEAERGPPAHQYGYSRGGYSNTAGRGGYNSGYNAGYTGYSPTPPPPSVSASPEVDPTATATAVAPGYDYSSYYNYYAQQPQSGQYTQYDANAYYSYYGYPPVDPNAIAPAATSPPPPASSSPIPPPPPASSGSIPPPPPPASSSPAPPPPPPPRSED
ncbi:hypothetical protein INT48_007463, partial [Thamnidium elegans]